MATNINVIDGINFVDLIQGTDKWKEFRKMKIGSSLAPSIDGVGFRTPLQLFEDIIEDREIADNEAMARGRCLEPIAREWLNKKYGINLQPAVVLHPKQQFDWHMSSLDGICKKADGTYFVTEIKCPGKVAHEQAKNRIIPEKYIPQCFHIFEDLPGVNEILYFSYSEDSQYEIWIKRDEFEMKVLFEKERAFYARLISFKPPEPSDKDWVQVTKADILSKANAYAKMKEQIEQLQEEAESLKNEIIEDTGYIARAKIGDVKLQKIIRQGTVDYSKIEVLKGLDLVPYRKSPIVSWRLA